METQRVGTKEGEGSFWRSISRHLFSSVDGAGRRLALGTGQRLSLYCVGRVEKEGRGEEEEEDEDEEEEEAAAAAEGDKV